MILFTKSDIPKGVLIILNALLVGCLANRWIVARINRPVRLTFGSLPAEYRWSKPVLSQGLSVCFTPNSKHLVVAGGRCAGSYLKMYVSGEYEEDINVREKHLQVWDVATERYIGLLAAQPIFGEWNGSHMNLMPGGRTLLTSWGASEIKAIDIHKRRPDKTLEVNNGYISSLAISPNGKILAVGMTSEVQFWDTRTFKLLRSHHNGGQATQVCFGPNSEVVECMWPGMRPEYVNVKTGKEVPTPPDAEDFGNTYSPNRKYFAMTDGLNTVELWKNAGRKSTKLHSWKSNLLTIEDLEFSPDSKMLAVGGMSSTAKPFELFPLQ